MPTLKPELLSRIDKQIPDCSDILVVGPVSVPKAAPMLTGPVPLNQVLEFEFSRRFDLGLVFDPSPQDAAAISRLRDLGCRRVLIVTDEGTWSTNELRALGFQAIEPIDDDRLAYLYDSDLFNQPRDWNNSSNWANPENFRKYRW